MTARNLQRWTALHRWTSLFVTVNLLLLAITGLFLIFHDEIEDALGTYPHPQANGAPAITMDRAVDLARGVQPSLRPALFVEDKEHLGLFIVQMLPPGETGFDKAKPVFVDGYAGKVLINFDPEKTLTAFVLHLHVDLFMGLGGSLYVALVGVTFFVSLVSGAVVYAPFVRGLKFSELRRDRGRRIFQLDLHNLVGVLTLAWCSVVAITGIVLELSRPALALYQMTDLIKLTAPYRGKPAPTQIVPLEQAKAVADKTWPGHKIAFAVFPGTQLSGDHHYAFFMATESGPAKRVYKLTMVDAATGELTLTSELPLYLKAILISGPLHFGDYAGMPLKIIWALFTVFTIVLCTSGIYLTVARIRSRRVEAPVPAAVPAPEPALVAREGMR